VPQTLLLADDSITIQRVIELTFADEDIQVVAVGDGDQAIERLETAPPDIVLADVGMPGRNGYEVAKYIKQSPKLSHIPVVLLTGAFEPVDQAKAAEAGCDGVLAKPFEPQLVIGRVKELLARPRQVSESLDVKLAPPPAAETEPLAPPLEAPVSQGAPPASANDYFDRLDNAFAHLSAPSPASSNPAAPLAELDWFIAQPKPTETQPADHPPAYALPAIDFDTYSSGNTPIPTTDGTLIVKASNPATIEWQAQAPPQVEAVQQQPPPAAPAPAAAAPITLPPIADAFAALLAAEQNQPTPAAAPTWPTSPQQPTIDTADFVEQVTERVLARLSDRLVRETVADIVSNIAERAVREEIERIKASIK
jgi:CheY-like chemotaxis protein